MARLSVFVAASALFWPALPWAGALKFALLTSPFVAICSSVSLRHVGIGAAAGFAVALVVMFRRRWFCRYICPTGLLLEGAARIGFAKTSWWAKCPPLGGYAALLTFFGAIAGYPFLLWMDPLAIFSNFFTIRTAGTILSGFLAGLGLGILLLLSLTSGTFWCTRLCPLGGIQDLLASAISGLRKTGVVTAESKKKIMPMRRALLLGAAGIGIGLLAGRTGAARGENAPLRPPGAVAEDVFAGLCTRCGNCIRVCPSKIILPDLGQAGALGFLAPVISYEEKYCLEDCNDCVKVCPSGALQPLELEQKRRYVIGEALVDGALCFVTLAQKDCDACVAACPFDAVRIHWDEDLYAAYPLIDANRCNGCGACEAACPVDGYKAIRVWKPATDYAELR
ncbi:MAG: 4Fe-4S binding protein [Acidobacteriota bacterium]|jgi:ferredoxin-type protein NapF|nr:4Fe-4S binding protein [Acidobacteriota bacterium]